MRTEYMWVFQITRKIVFEVNYYTLGSNKNANFTTSAAMFNQPKTDFNSCGQCQHELLRGKARSFWLKWKNHHLHDLTDQEYNDLLADVEKLKKTYNYIEDSRETYANTYHNIGFYRIKNLSMMDIKKEVE